MLARPTPRLAQRPPLNRSVSSDPTQAHSPNPHSNKQPTKPNPAISRLSASPTAGNDPPHPNVRAWRPRNLHQCRHSSWYLAPRCSFTEPDLRCVEGFTASPEFILAIQAAGWTDRAIDFFRLARWFLKPSAFVAAAVRPIVVCCGCVSSAAKTAGDSQCSGKPSSVSAR